MNYLLCVCHWASCGAYDSAALLKVTSTFFFSFLSPAFDLYLLFFSIYIHYSIKESFFLGGFSCVRLRYLGEKFILLSCEEEGVIGKLIEDNKDWFDGMLDSVVPWDDSFVVKEKLLWFIKVDEATVRREVLEYVRLCITIPVGEKATLVKEVQINNIFWAGVRGGEEKTVQFPEMLEKFVKGGTCLSSVINYLLEGQKSALELKANCSLNDTHAIRQQDFKEDAFKEQDINASWVGNSVRPGLGIGPGFDEEEYSRARKVGAEAAATQGGSVGGGRRCRARWGVPSPFMDDAGTQHLVTGGGPGFEEEEHDGVCVAGAEVALGKVCDIEGVGPGAAVAGELPWEPQASKCMARGVLFDKGSLSPFVEDGGARCPTIARGPGNICDLFNGSQWDDE
ncbi:hypothetical protein VNO80_22123 [Phaseolus coccineus]|uniref:DUF4283 domain-containing protein n=1 Tax=Phaseolus coccineus TaxID=3886 RepID=A0AAN9M9T6_PHACN